MPIVRPLAATLVLLTALGGAAPAAAQWVGGNRSTVRRAEQPAPATAPAPPPILGGLDLTGYCRQRGYYVARLENATWICVSENGRMDVDLNEACRAAFGPEARARRMSDSPMSWLCVAEAPRPADMGEGAATASPDADAGVAPPVAAPAGTTPASPTTSPGAAPVEGTVAPPILGIPPLAPPVGTDPQAPADPAPGGPLALWTGLPFYARAVIAGLGALVLGLLLGTMLRRKGG